MSYDLRRAGPLLCRSGATEMEPKIEDGASDEESGEQLTKKVLFYGLGTGESSCVPLHFSGMARS
jgi:hypothetical protein